MLSRQKGREEHACRAGPHGPYSLFANYEFEARRMELKTQDLIVLLKVAAHPPRRWTYAELSTALSMSASETHASVKRAVECGLAVSHGRDG